MPSASTSPVGSPPKRSWLKRALLPTPIAPQALFELEQLGFEREAARKALIQASVRRGGAVDVHDNVQGAVDELLHPQHCRTVQLEDGTSTFAYDDACGICQKLQSTIAENVLARNVLTEKEQRELANAEWRRQRDIARREMRRTRAPAYTTHTPASHHVSQHLPTYEPAGAQAVAHSANAVAINNS